MSDQVLVIIVKIIGGVIAAITTLIVLGRIKLIFAGKDKKLDKQEWLEMVSVLFFIAAGGFMLIVEGTRDHEWHYFGAAWLAVIFGSLLTVLGMKHAVENITAIFKPMQTLKETKTEITDDNIKKESTTINSSSSSDSIN